MFKTFFSRNKFPAKIILLTLVFCFVSIPTGFAAEGGSFNWPLKGEVITPFGSYVHPVSGETKSHSGIDIKGTPDSEIFAAADGTVYFSGFTPAGGNDGSVKNTITILHSNGYKTTYLQLKDISVNKGDNVLQGQAIGKLAVSGDISSPETHLHFGIKDENGNPVNPENFLLLSSSGQDNSSASSENSNPAPVETSDNSLSSGPPETSVVISEGSSVQNHSDPVQTSEAKNNVQVDSINVVSESVKDETPQESIVSSGDSEKYSFETGTSLSENIKKPEEQITITAASQNETNKTETSQTSQVTVVNSVNNQKDSINQRSNSLVNNTESKTEADLSSEVFISQKDKNDNKNQISNSIVSAGESLGLLQKIFIDEDKNISVLIKGDFVDDGLGILPSLNILASLSGKNSLESISVKVNQSGYGNKLLVSNPYLPKIPLLKNAPISMFYQKMTGSDNLAKKSDNGLINDNMFQRFSIKKYLSQFRSLSFETKENNPPLPPFTKGGMGGLLLLLITLGILIFSTELKKLKGYRLKIC